MEYIQMELRTRMRWYRNNLMEALRLAKNQHARDIDVTIGVAEKLLEALDQKVAIPRKIQPHIPALADVIMEMKPVEQELIDQFYQDTEKGGGERYLKQRYKKAPEEKFNYRIQSSWDYGWQQKQSQQQGREVYHPRCAILRDTFYRKNRVEPDPVGLAQPTGATASICSAEYSCVP